MRGRRPAEIYVPPERKKAQFYVLPVTHRLARELAESRKMPMGAWLDALITDEAARQESRAS